MLVKPVSSGKKSGYTAKETISRDIGKGCMERDRSTVRDRMRAAE